MKNFETHLWYRLIKRFSFLLSIKLALVTVLCYYAGFYISTLYHFAMPELGGLWCAISGVVVLQVFINESLQAAWLRILGSFVGAATSYVFSLFATYSIPLLGMCVFTTVMLTSALKIKETFRLASLTAAIIIIIGISNPAVPPLENAVSRFIESAIGAIIAIMITAVFFPLRKKLHLLGR